MKGYFLARHQVELKVLWVYKNRNIFLNPFFLTGMNK